MGAALATLGAGGVAVGLVHAVQGLKDRGRLSSVAARKLMHTGTREWKGFAVMRAARTGARRLSSQSGAAGAPRT